MKLATYKATKTTNGDYFYRGYRVWACDRFTGLWNISDYKYENALQTAFRSGEYIWDQDIDTSTTFTYTFKEAKAKIDFGYSVKGRLLTWQEEEQLKANTLPDSITIGNYTRNKEKFGHAATRPEHRTFTGEVLWNSQLRADPQGNCWRKSVQQNWASAHIQDGIVYWNNNGQVPPMEWLLDFVQIGEIDFATAERSYIQKQHEQSESLKHLMVNSTGEVCLHADAFKTYESRKI
tara:strand:+ start:3584 stop:4288 length:705 start_codon:yes stop_codon:yes gene_type:complete